MLPAVHGCNAPGIRPDRCSILAPECGISDLHRRGAQAGCAGEKGGLKGFDTQFLELAP
jgi:hypothetical protein